MPASTSMIGLRIDRIRGRAYSERYTAAPRPSGAATTMATPVTIRLPTSRVPMLNRFCRGFHTSLAKTRDHSTSRMNSQPLLNSE